MSPPRLDPPLIGRVGAALARCEAPAGLRPFVASAADLDALHALGAAIFPGEALSRADWRRRLTRGHSLVLGLRAGESIACYTLVELNRRQERVYVVETATDPAWRGRGLGRWVRAHLHAVVFGLGYRSIATHVRAKNTAAQALNRSLGMRLVGRVPGYYDDGEDAFAYAARRGEALAVAALSGLSGDPGASPR